ncbi:MAG: hypothetical protein KAI29_17550, partial [Cyclobacteriaceae bacterium]|nr:hypothetical protein [Cyclobacteriaceae bacterium]
MCRCVPIARSNPWILGAFCTLWRRRGICWIVTWDYPENELKSYLSLDPVSRVDARISDPAPYLAFIL